LTVEVEIEIVVYAAFAENGNIQLLGRSRAPFENLYNLVDNPQPLMTVAQHQEIVDRLRGENNLLKNALSDQKPKGSNK